MSADDDAPVIVGVGAVGRPADDPASAVEAVELMHRAVGAALDDVGSAGGAAVDRLDWIGVPEGTWAYRDPGRLLAERLGRPSVHTVLADVGVLQQTLLDAACDAVARGGARVALVVGGEAKHRASHAVRTGGEAAETAQEEGTAPDEHLRTSSLGVLDLEIVRDAVAPVTAYALIEHAMAARDGRTVEAQRDRIAALWARYALVAAANPDAWDRTPYPAADIREPSAANRMLATPYTKRLCSQWNVDQAAAVLVCTRSTASALGVPPDRWVFAHGSACSNHAVAVTERADLAACPGADLVAAALLGHTGAAPDDLGPVDLYSCFPSAVEALAASFGLPVDDPAVGLTVTGGMAFAGGPLNSYVLQALVTLVRRLRSESHTVGLSSSVSGFLVKQGASLWAARPPSRPWRSIDVTAATAAYQATVPVVDDHDGPGRVASWTVVHDQNHPARVVALVDLPGGARTIAASVEPEVVAAWCRGAWVGTRVEVRPGGRLVAPA